MTLARVPLVQVRRYSPNARLVNGHALTMNPRVRTIKSAGDRCRGSRWCGRSGCSRAGPRSTRSSAPHWWPRSRPSLHRPCTSGGGGAWSCRTGGSRAHRWAAGPRRSHRCRAVPGPPGRRWSARPDCRWRAAVHGCPAQQGNRSDPSRAASTARCPLVVIALPYPIAWMMTYMSDAPATVRTRVSLDGCSAWASGSTSLAPM